MIREVPGGGDVKGNANFTDLATKELKEETGLWIDPDRFVPLEARQNGGTISTHIVYGFGVPLNAEEMEKVRNTIEEGSSFGVETDTEQTYLEIKTLRQMIEDQDVDWTNLGMIFTALTQYYE
jgi:ADP-ribose pyrophosphatase YjhB (NUDIX family)